jgi:hypothetical protein
LEAEYHKRPVAKNNSRKMPFLPQIAVSNIGGVLGGGEWMRGHLYKYRQAQGRHALSRLAAL